MKNKAENGIQIIKAKASELYNINGQYNDFDNKKVQILLKCQI